MGNYLINFITSPIGIITCSIIFAIVVIVILAFVIYTIVKKRRESNNQFGDNSTNYDEDREIFNRSRGKVKSYY